MTVLPQVSRGREGFTLYGVVVALVLLSVALHPLVTTLASNTRNATDRRDRMDAERVLQNELAILASADPDAVPALREYRADRTGRLDPGGSFAVSSRRSVRCSVGGAPWDNALDPPPAGCPGGGVVHEYSVAVSFSRAAGPGETAEITRLLAVGAARSSGAASPPGQLP